MYCKTVTLDPYRKYICKGEPVFNWTGNFVNSLA